MAVFCSMCSGEIHASENYYCQTCMDVESDRDSQDASTPETGDKTDADTPLFGGKASDELKEKLADLKWHNDLVGDFIDELQRAVEANVDQEDHSPCG